MYFYEEGESNPNYIIINISLNSTDKLPSNDNFTSFNKKKEINRKHMRYKNNKQKQKKKQKKKIKIIHLYN